MLRRNQLFLGVILLILDVLPNQGQCKINLWKDKEKVVILSTLKGASVLWSQFDAKLKKSKLYEVVVDEKGQVENNPKEIVFLQTELMGEITLLRGDSVVDSSGNTSVWLVAVVENKEMKPRKTQLYYVHYLLSKTNKILNLKEKIEKIQLDFNHPKVEITAMLDGGVLFATANCHKPLGLKLDENLQEHQLSGLIDNEANPLSIQKPIDLEGCALFSGILWSGTVRPYHSVFCYQNTQKAPSFDLPWKYANFEGLNPRRIWTRTKMITVFPIEKQHSSSFGMSQEQSTFHIYLESLNAFMQESERKKTSWQFSLKQAQLHEFCNNGRPILDIQYEDGHLELDPIQDKLPMSAIFPNEYGSGNALLSINENGELQKRVCLPSGILSKRETISF